MRKKAISTIIAMALTFGTSYKALAAPNDSMNENKAKYQQLNSEIVSLNSQISDLDNQIGDLNSKLDENNDNIRKVKGEIDSNEAKLQKTKEELEKEQETFSKRVRAIYKSNSSTEYLSILLTSKSFSDFLSRANAVNKIISLDKKLINEINEKKEILDDTIEKLNSQEKELQDLKKSTEDDISKIKEKKAEQKKYLDELNAQKDQVASIIEANESELIAKSVSIINDSQDISAIKEAIKTLKDLLPQITTDSVKNKAQSAISNGNDKISSMSAVAKVETGSRGNTSSIQNGPGNYKKTLTMQATAYSGGTLTATGSKPVRNPGGISTIAVDPRVIPLGTKVYVERYGMAIATDTGGAIKGNIIDLYMNSHSECIAWGRQNVTVNIIAYPGEW
ncbi:3D domain-containing protein [Clostridium fallax]|uniref:3D (Asp-Asp-Asp) domain-containing protein n=1 Tax=Clostridium fallax TaxID=1533 RepID=A0A1M4X8G1_9CLOT|nr:3D domain-containing protein [Clostridium fallax]SHE89780.1 3D (Asp-Asp-Asp) domain-containing protein [Clostridium fallax]SQB07363.1 cell wall-binding protein [Clostridium fallax]